MEQNLIIVSRSEDIRRSFLESYSLLGYEVTAAQDIVEVIRELNNLDPDHVIMDIEGLPRQWKVVAAGLKLAQKDISVVLLAATMTAEQANEAAFLGVAGVIIKPFQPEFHLKRVYDLIRGGGGGKRVYPRFYAGSVFEGSLEYHSETTNKLHLFELVNVSEAGAAVRTRDLAAAPELQPSAPIAAALHFQRIAQAPDALARFDPELSLLVASCYGQARLPDKATQTLVALKQRNPQLRKLSKARIVLQLPAARLLLTGLCRPLSECRRTRHPPAAPCPTNRHPTRSKSSKTPSLRAALRREPLRAPATRNPRRAHHPQGTQQRATAPLN